MGSFIDIKKRGADCRPFHDCRPSHCPVSLKRATLKAPRMYIDNTPYYIYEINLYKIHLHKIIIRDVYIQPIGRSGCFAF